MDSKRWPLGIIILISTVTAVILDFILFYALIRVTGAIIENKDRSLFVLSVLLVVLCGFMFIAAEVTVWVIYSKTGNLKKKDIHAALFISAVLYALVMIFIFPESLNILNAYLPKSELGPGLSLLFFQLSSYAAAALCGIVNVVGICKTDK